MATIQKTVAALQAKKQEASKIRRQSEKQLKNAKSILRRSRSGLASADRRIESAKEELSDVSLVLSQKTAQKDSVLRLIGGAEGRLNQERDAKEQAGQDAEFADTEEERLAAQRRLRGILERISDIEFEIKNRKKTAKKLEDEISGYSGSRAKIATKIKKASQAKPGLKRLLQSSAKDSEKLSKQVERSSKQETNAKKNLKKAEEKLRDHLSRKRKLAAKKRSKPGGAAAKKAPKKAAGKTRAKPGGAAAKKAARKVTTKTKKAKPKRTAAKKAAGKTAPRPRRDAAKKATQKSRKR